ncbi:serine/threonine protein kinase, partial [Streptomyces sp. NPDC004561]
RPHAVLQRVHCQRLHGRDRERASAGVARRPSTQQYPPPQQPQRYAPEPQRPAREPRPPRQRSANPMKIPGLGCLKGCLFTIVILVVASWLVWELTPLHTWVGQGRSYWHEVSHWAGQVSRWVKDLGGSSSGGH